MNIMQLQLLASPLSADGTKGTHTPLPATDSASPDFSSILQQLFGETPDLPLQMAMETPVAQEEPLVADIANDHNDAPFLTMTLMPAPAVFSPATAVPSAETGGEHPLLQSTDGNNPISRIMDSKNLFDHPRTFPTPASLHTAEASQDLAAGNTMLPDAGTRPESLLVNNAIRQNATSGKDIAFQPFHEASGHETRGVVASGVDGQHPESSLPSAVQGTDNRSTAIVSTPAQASLATPLASPQWRQEFGRQLLGMAQRGEQRVSLQLNPAELGPVSVELKLVDQQAQVQLFSGHAQVRSALEQAIPQLREALAEQGISLGETSIGEQNRQQWQEQRDSQSAFASADTVAMDTADDAATDNTHPGATALSLDSGINLYV